MFVLFIVLMVSGGLQISYLISEYLKSSKELKRKEKENKILSELSKATLNDKMKKMKEENKYF